MTDIGASKTRLFADLRLDDGGTHWVKLDLSGPETAGAGFKTLETSGNSPAAALQALIDTVEIIFPEGGFEVLIKGTF